jgi:hypothetical protein
MGNGRLDSVPECPVRFDLHDYHEIEILHGRFNSFVDLVFDLVGVVHKSMNHTVPHAFYVEPDH